MTLRSIGIVGALAMVIAAVLSLTACSQVQVQQAATALSALRAQFIDNDGDGIDDNLEQKLADRFAPVVLMEPDESNYPVNVEWFLARAHLQYHEDCSGDIDLDVGPDPLVTQQQLIGPPWSEGPHCGQGDTGYSHPPHRLITTIEADPDGQASDGNASTGYSDQQAFVMPDLPDADRVGSLDPTDWTTYFHLYPAADGGVMIQYWHLFAYNSLGIAGIGDHGGDWDAEIQVHVKGDLDTVEDVTFSRHSEDSPGTDLPPSQVTFVDSTHPLMTIDGGGHAAYAGPDDYCRNRSLNQAEGIGTAVWPGDPSRPLDASNLKQIICISNPLLSASILGSTVGGTVWDTSSDGSVFVDGNITHRPATTSHSGPLVNLGEYNPCTPAACNDSRQASTMLAGQFRPLNGQVFIRYEGYWGSLPAGSDPGPPRGPVFQGEQDEGQTKGVIYTAWYNQGADVPANPSFCPWLAPPVTTASTAQGSGSTTVTLSRTENPVARSAAGTQLASGAFATYYRFYAPATTAPGFLLYTGPFSPPHGDTVDFFSIDELGNIETTKSMQA